MNLFCCCYFLTAAAPQGAGVRRLLAAKPFCAGFVITFAFLKYTAAKVSWQSLCLNKQEIKVLLPLEVSH